MAPQNRVAILLVGVLFAGLVHEAQSSLPPVSGACQGDSTKASKASASNGTCVCNKNAYSKGGYANGQGAHYIASAFSSCFPSGLTIGRGGTTFTGRNLNFCSTAYSAYWGPSANVPGTGACAMQEAITSNGSGDRLTASLVNALLLPGSKPTQLIAAVLNTAFDKCGSTASCTDLLFADLVLGGSALHTACDGYTFADLIDYSHYIVSNAEACPGNTGHSLCISAGIPASLCTSGIDVNGACFGVLFGTDPAFHTVGGINGYSNGYASADCDTPLVPDVVDQVLAPSATPSPSPSDLPSPSPSPSHLPSPSPSPSHLPSPSASPSDLPSPSPIPTGLPSDIPTPTAPGGGGEGVDGVPGDKTPDAQVPSSAVWGDPHVKSWDGLIATYVGCGDSVLAKTADNSFMFQARTCLRGNDAASTCAVAFRCSKDADVVEVYATRTGIRTFVSGGQLAKSEHKIVHSDDKGTEISSQPGQFAITCASGPKLEVFERENSDGSIYLDTRASLPLSFKGKVSGLAGTFNGRQDDDIISRDGTVWNADHGLDYVSAIDHPSLQQVQNSWTPLAKERLFHLIAEESEATCTTSNQHRKVLSSVKSTAEEECKAMGFSGPWFTTCIFDYTRSSGDPKSVINHKQAHADFTTASKPNKRALLSIQKSAPMADSSATQ